MPSKKSTATREIIRAVSGISVDPLAEKFVEVLISRYRRNRRRGQKKSDSLKNAARDIFFSIAGIRYQSVTDPTPRNRSGMRPKPAKAKEETEEEALARLKKLLDGYIDS